MSTPPPPLKKLKREGRIDEEFTMQRVDAQTKEVRHKVHVVIIESIKKGKCLEVTDDSGEVWMIVHDPYADNEDNEDGECVKGGDAYRAMPGNIQTHRGNTTVTFHTLRCEYKFTLSMVRGCVHNGIRIVTLSESLFDSPLENEDVVIRTVTVVEDLQLEVSQMELLNVGRKILFDQISGAIREHLSQHADDANLRLVDFLSQDKKPLAP
jgi:hypothetical protein